jgi:hypothetical protein
MIREIKDILQSVVEQRCPGITVVRSEVDRQQAVRGRKFPLVSLITNPGGFDDREAKTIRYYDQTAGTYKQRYVRGSRIVPILLACWAEGEDETDTLFSRILPAIPRQFTLDGFEGLVLINGEEHSDYAGNVSKLYVSVAEIQFTVAVALEAEIVPTITQTQVEPDLVPPASTL